MEKTAFINDTAYPIQAGESILTFVQRHLGPQSIPTLCDAPNLEPFGACRLCSVEVARPGAANPKTVGSCHTPVAEGMRIFPDSPAIRKLRRNILELVISDHPMECGTCEADGSCELQKVVLQVGMDPVRYPAGKNHRDTPKDTSHPYVISDLSKCIQCYRCIRACDEVQGQFVLSMAGRGFDNQVIKGLNTSFTDSGCVSCGACVQSCPTSAISDVYRRGAALATETVRTVCTYCGVGCNLEVAKKGNTILRITAPYDAEVNHGHTCLKGRYAFRFYNHPDRLKTPLIRRNGVLEPVSWEAAYDFIAEKLQAIKRQNGPDAIAGISSARCTNEENYLMQKFIRAVIGTNNIDGCARVCHAPTALGMQRTFGTGAATNSIDELKDTACILLIGANPTAAHPVTGAKIKQQAMKGKTLIVIDPRKTELARYAHYHLQLRPGTNVALLNLMLYYILSEGWEDRSFIEKRTEGFSDFRDHILALDPSALEAVCGVPRALVREAALAYAKAPNAMSFHGLGVTEHSQGTLAVMLIADLAMVTGNIGRRGVGVNPLRGQNNVQGAADMGVQPNLGPGYLDLGNPEIRLQFEQVYGTTLPSKPGLKIPEMLDAALEGKLKALWIMGEDVVQTEPNTQKVRAALQSLDLFILQELFLSDTASYAHVILPASSFFEKSGTFTNGERRVQRVNQVIDPLPGSKPDGQIIVEMMNHMGYPQPGYNPAQLLEEIAQVTPFFKGIRWERLGKNGLQWPVSEDGTGTKILHTESFKLGNGKLIAADFQESRELLNHAGQYPLILTTNRQLEHYNSGSMTRRTNDALILGEDVLLIHPEDAEKRGIADGQTVRLSSARGEINIRASLTNQVKPGVVSATFHFPEIALNDITGPEHDSEAKCPEYKVVAVEVEGVGR